MVTFQGSTVITNIFEAQRICEFPTDTYLSLWSFCEAMNEESLPGVARIDPLLLRLVLGGLAPEEVDHIRDDG